MCISTIWEIRRRLFKGLAVKMKDSIIINMDYAMYDVIDGTPFVERHHCIGGPNRKLADEDGLWVPLTPEHHRTGKDSAHLNKVTHTLLEIIAQLAYEKKKVAEGNTETEARELFRKRYGRSYL